MIDALLTGVASTLAAATALTLCIGLGSAFLGRTDPKDPGFLPLAVIAGAALNGAAYALFSHAGHVIAGVVAVAAVSTLVTIVRWRRVREAAANGVANIRGALAESRAGRWIFFPLLAVAWINSIAPPRAGDVVRYHLAHLRQIIADERWERIAAFHYALPFGWSFNYLPLELLRLPEAAGVLNLGLWLIVLATLLGRYRGALTSQLALLVSLVFLAHPFGIRLFTSAFPDAYSILLVLVVVLGLLDMGNRTRFSMTLLGFVIWIGPQSRYQLLAASVAASAVVLFVLLRRRAWNDLARLAFGAALAILLCAPFYLANLDWFGTPFWPVAESPLLPDSQEGLIGNAVERQGILATLTDSIPGLMLHLFVFPLPLVLCILTVATLILRVKEYWRVATFVGLFAAIWAYSGPDLFPPYILILLAAGPVLSAGLLTRFPDLTRRRAFTIILSTVAFGLSGITAAASLDHIRYALSGNLSEYHRFTFGYRVYDWVNNNTPRNARLLVVVYSGHTYYLNRHYRRADPWLTFDIDWSRVGSPAALDSLMAAGGYDYLIFQDIDWSDHPGGSQMTQVVRASIADSVLVPAHTARVRMYTSRVFRDYEASDVYVLTRGATD